MSISTFPECLRSLVNFLNGLERRATKEELHNELSKLDVCQNDLREFACFGEATYRRNLVCESQYFELLCICWDSGQRSPIHNHAHSTCGLRVIEGTATETRFDQSPCGQVMAVCSENFPSGAVCSSQDADIHQVSNLQGPGDKLITLHIYSPPLRTMSTYSILGGEPEQYSPHNAQTPCD